MHFSILYVMIVKIKTVRWRLIDTFFFSSTSCFDLTGFFSPVFIMPIEKDFNLLCEIVCRKHGEPMNLISARETTKLVMQNEYFWEKLFIKISRACLPSSIRGLIPLGISPKEDFYQDLLASSPPLHLRRKSVIPRMLCSETGLRMTMSIIITKQNKK